MRFLDELKRRGVIRAAIAYVALAWLMIQVAETLLPLYGFGDAAIRNLVTVLATGFVPALVLSWVFEWTPEGWRRESAEPHERAAPAAGRRLNAVIIAVLMAGLVLFAIDELVIERTPAGDYSIAVLAFDDMSPAGDQEYFSDGIAEEILNLLAGVEELQVISRSSSFSFKGSDLTLREIADRLGVTYILEGSVRRQGASARITVQLIDARSDRHIWSDTYDRDISDIFAVQDDVAANIVGKLNATLLGRVPRAVEVDARVFDLTLQAKYLLHKDDPERLADAEALLDQALAIDPNYLRAIIELDRVAFREWVRGAVGDEDYLEQRLDSLRRIEAIAPDSAELYFLKASIAWLNESDLQAAAGYTEKALRRRGPGDVNGLRMVTLFLIELGRFDEAIEIGNFVVLRDPVCSTCISNLALAYRRAGRYEEALATLQEMLKWRDPDDSYYWSLGTVALMQGLPQQALDHFEKINDESMRAFASIFALHDLGRVDEFDRRLQEYARSPGNAEGMARIFAWTGDSDKAFEWLDRAIAEEGPTLVAEIATDYYRKIKPDPRWRELRLRYGYDDEAVANIRFELPPGITRGGG